MTIIIPMMTNRRIIICRRRRTISAAEASNKVLLSFGIDGSGRILLLLDTFNAGGANGDVVGSSS